MKSIYRWVWSGIFVAVVATTPQAHAQDVLIHGEALDRVTHLPVGDVVIQIRALKLVVISDSTGYFAFPALPAGEYVVNAFHTAYVSLSEETSLIAGDVLVVNLTPQPITLAGVEVSVDRPEIDAERASGTPYDVISSADFGELRDRQSRVLEVLRQKAPPRLKIRQGGTGSGSCQNPALRARASSSACS